MPVADKFVWPLRASKVDPSRSVSSSQFNWLFQISQNPLRALPVQDVIHIHWSTSLWNFYFDIYDWHILATRRKVLSLTNPKSKIYKTKSLRHYITQWTMSFIITRINIPSGKSQTKLSFVEILERAIGWGYLWFMWSSLYGICFSKRFAGFYQYFWPLDDYLLCVCCCFLFELCFSLTYANCVLFRWVVLKLWSIFWFQLHRFFDESFVFSSWLLLLLSIWLDLPSMLRVHWGRRNFLYRIPLFSLLLEMLYLISLRFLNILQVLENARCLSL